MARKSDVEHSDPDILSGTPVFVGTRVPVQSLFDYLEAGDTLDEFCARSRPFHATKPSRRSSSRATRNRELLRRAAGQIDALVTMDRKLEHQHDVSVQPFGLIVVRAHSNRMQDLRPLVGEIQDAGARVRPGTIQCVGK